MSIERDEAIKIYNELDAWIRSTSDDGLGTTAWRWLWEGRRALHDMLAENKALKRRADALAPFVLHRKGCRTFGYFSIPGDPDHVRLGECDCGLAAAQAGLESQGETE